MRLLLELDEVHIYEITAIYRSEGDGDGVHACTSFETVGGPKAYARAWDETPDLEWGWSLHPSARCVWKARD